MMISRRIVLVALVCFALSPFLLVAAGPRPAGPDQGLGFGTWEFTGQDKTGTVWKGTLVIEKPDRNMFESPKVIAQGNLQIAAADGSGLGALAPIQYDPEKRIVTMGGDGDYGGTTFTAVLSADGKRLTKGAWRETEWVSETKTKRLVREGEWSATRIEK
jgi:hypothetical protein